MSNKHVRELARRLARLEQRVNARTPQLAYSSIEDGAIEERDSDGNLVGRIGKQEDGSHGVVVYTGPTPPTPTGATAQGGAEIYSVTWRGEFDGDPATIPTHDWTRAEIHQADDPDTLPEILPDSSTRVGTIESVGGGAIAVKAEVGTYWIRLVSRSASGKVSAPSDPIEVTVSAVVTDAELDQIETDVAEAVSNAQQAKDDAAAAVDDALTAFNRANDAYDDAQQAIADAGDAATAAANAQSAAEDAAGVAAEAQSAAATAQGKAEDAETAALEAAGIAASKGTVYWNTPDNPPEGDPNGLWIRSGVPFRWDGSDWVEDENPALAQAIADAASAKTEAQQAAADADQAAQDAAEAASAAAAAQASADLAEIAADQAEIDAGIAAQKASDAETSAGSAAQSAGEAAEDAGEAAASANAAQGHASNAASSASSAASDASAAADSASDAWDAATAAQDSASNAQAAADIAQDEALSASQRADAAALSASSAQSAADAAEIAAGEAQTAAQAAATDAQQAATDAGEAVSQAQEAYTKAVSAETDADAAVTTANSAATTASNAATAASDAQSTADNAWGRVTGWTKTGTTTIDGGQIAADSILAAQIAAGEIVGDHIAANAIDAGKIAANSIETGHIVSGAITADEIDAYAVTAGKVAADAITAGTIAANAVTAGTIAADAITAREIQGETITGDLIAGNAIVADHLTANAIQAGHIAADQIQTNHIATNQITADHLAANSVTADQIKANAVTAAAIDAGAIKATHIESGVINADHLATGTLSATNIETGNLTADIQITTGSLQVGDEDEPHVEIADGKVRALLPGEEFPIMLGDEIVGWAPGEPIEKISIGGEGDAFRVTDDEGALIGGIQSDGSMVTPRLDAGEIRLGGDDITAILDPMPRGVVVWSEQITNTYGPYNERTGVWEFMFDAYAGRRYQITVSADFGGSGETTITGLTKTQTSLGGTPVAPRVSHSMFGPGYRYISAPGSFKASEISWFFQPGSNETARFLWFIQPFSGDTVQVRNFRVIVTDLGINPQNEGRHSLGGASGSIPNPTPPAQDYVKEFWLTSHASWTQYGRNTSYKPHLIRHGTGGSSYYRTYLPFSSTLLNTLANADSVQKIEVRLTQASGYWNVNPYTGLIATTNVTSSEPQIYYASQAGTTWQQGDTKWFTLNSSQRNALAGGTYKGLVIGRKSSATLVDYYGTDASNSVRPKVRVHYRA